METIEQSKPEKKSSPLLETGSLAAALPGNKSADQRPKYVQILKHEKNDQRAVKSPMSLGASDTSTSEKKTSENKSKTGEQPRNNNNKTAKTFTPNGRSPIKKVFLKKQEVLPLPPGIKVREMEISPDNVVFFSGPTNFMSALYPVKIVVDGNNYNSVEHYYQACKLFTLVGKDTASELKSATTPIEVKKATKNILRGKANQKQIAEWKAKDSFLVLKHAMLQKFSQHEDLKTALLDTGDKILIQTYFGDNFYAAGANTKFTSNWVTRHMNQSIKMPAEIHSDNFKYLPLIANGKNAFGWILMHVREELRAK